MILTNWTWTFNLLSLKIPANEMNAVFCCISGGTEFEPIGRTKSTGSEHFLFTYLRSISFVIILKVEMWYI